MADGGQTFKKHNIMKKIDLALKVTLHITLSGREVDEATFESLETLMEKHNGEADDDTRGDELTPAIDFLNQLGDDEADSWEYKLTKLEEAEEEGGEK